MTSLCFAHFKLPAPGILVARDRAAIDIRSCSARLVRFGTYSHIILDEVHERSVDADLLTMLLLGEDIQKFSTGDAACMLAPCEEFSMHKPCHPRLRLLMQCYIKVVTSMFSDLRWWKKLATEKALSSGDSVSSREVKLIVMSATLQAEVFARYFASLEGRRLEAKSKTRRVPTADLSLMWVSPRILGPRRWRSSSGEPWLASVIGQKNESEYGKETTTTATPAATAAAAYHCCCCCCCCRRGCKNEHPAPMTPQFVNQALQSCAVCFSGVTQERQEDLVFGSSPHPFAVFLGDF